MNEFRIDQARKNAASDIAHRWFAFFEGKTESVTDHLDIFSDDVRLVHAGVHLLAEGKKDLQRWLTNDPEEKSSHFIKTFDLLPLGKNIAEVNMMVSYQREEQGLLAGGAIIEYRTRVIFDDQDKAAFTFIQKTPLAVNPAHIFEPSFDENRMKSFIAHFCYLISTFGQSSVVDLLAPQGECRDFDKIFTLLRSTKHTDILIREVDISSLRCTLEIRGRQESHKLTFKLEDLAGRYLKIVRLDIN